MALHAKYLNITEFSNYRFMIPQLCGFKGRAIWVDSDMICFRPLDELFNLEMGDNDFLAKQATDSPSGTRWALSVSLFDNARCQFNMDLYAREIAQGLYEYNDLHQMTANFLARHPFKIGALDPNWNCYDKYTEQTKIIHYTNLHSQPWKFRGHRHGAVWFKYFKEAQEAGFISDDDIDRAIRRAYVRFDLRQGNTIGVGTIVHNALSDLKATVLEGVGLRRL